MVGSPSQLWKDLSIIFSSLSAVCARMAASETSSNRSSLLFKNLILNKTLPSQNQNPYQKHIPFLDRYSTGGRSLGMFLNSILLNNNLSPEKYSLNTKPLPPIRAPENLLTSGKSEPEEFPSTPTSRLFQYGKLGAKLAFNTFISTVSNQSFNIKSPENISQISSTLARMRGASLKVGQMLSLQEGEHLPPPLGEIMSRLRDSANFLPEEKSNEIFETQKKIFYPNWFDSYESIPFAAASLGQVHFGKFQNIPVAIKIQYPGAADSIDSDLADVSKLLHLSSLLPDGLYLDNSIRVAKNELKLECDYNREARMADKFRDFLSRKPELNKYIHVPRIFHQVSSKDMLVMEFMRGKSIDKSSNLSQSVRDSIASRLFQLCLSELFEFRLIQSDPNWSNFLYDEDTDSINLLDFGAALEIEPKFSLDYYSIIKSAAENDEESVLSKSIEMGFLTGSESKTMTQAHIDSVLTLGSAFRGGPLDFKTQNIYAAVTKNVPLMLRDRLTPPPDQSYSIHRKLAGIFGLCSKLQVTIDCNKYFQQIVLPI